MQEIVFLIERYGLLVVFLNMLLDQAGLPLPAYPTLMLAAALGGRGGGQIAEIIAAGAGGALVADLGWYLFGARKGRRVLGLLCKISLSPDFCVRQTESVFAKVGSLSLLFAKFVPGLGVLSTALSGIMRIPLPKFVLLDGVGATLYVGVAVGLGAMFRNAIASVLATLSNLGEFGLIALLGALAAYLSLRWWQRQVFIRRLRMDRISVDELADMIGRGENPLILDVRPAEARLREGIIPGAQFAHPSDAIVSLASSPRDVEIVVYCACPNEASAATAARHLRRAGFRKIRPLLGGIQAWTDAGQPIVMIESAVTSETGREENPVKPAVTA